jgi:hypothetical protein
VFAADSPETSGSSSGGPLGEAREVVGMLRDYAKQETLGPLKGWTKYVLNGLVASLLLGVGLIITAVGLLRLLQTETTAFNGPASSLVAYLITLLACAGIIGLVGWQIRRRTSLQRKDSL